MKCNQCEIESKKSTIQIGMSFTTAMMWHSYYDENGNLHNHDPNTTTTEYKCSNGHEWKLHHRSQCEFCK